MPENASRYSTKISAPPGGKTRLAVFDDASSKIKPQKKYSNLKSSPESDNAGLVNKSIKSSPDGVSEPLRRGQLPVWARQSYTLGGGNFSSEAKTVAQPMLQAEPVKVSKTNFGSEELHFAGQGPKNPDVRKLGSAEELPDSARQHNIFHRKSLVDDPRFVSEIEKTHEEVMEGRVPPGGRSNLSLASEHQKEVPAKGRGRSESDSDRAPAGVRRWKERTPPREERPPPGGKTTIQLG